MNKKKLPPHAPPVLYGVHPVLETIKAGKRPLEKIYISRGPIIERELAALLEPTGIPIVRISATDMLSIAGSPHHQGLAARVGPFPYAEIEDLLAQKVPATGVVLILDEIQDPANLGSILRSAECLGAAAVILTKDRACSITPAAEKAAAGASAHIPVVRVVNLARTIDQLKAAGFWVYAADSRAKDMCYSIDLTGQVALVLGSEGKGIRRLVLEKCDNAVFIPMCGKVDSLNVAQTAAILLGEALRQRLVRDRGSTVEQGNVT
ncbi:MAG: 23S rRNA (guanosine(2251)-2'-O)-methyltransferase RlmB [Desulfomonile tiedjei]|nr:23S rRNA (guanosine(2251)-2'-O)-methyltransferase RlmB [Desulfomonile tiedjei]